MLVAPSILSADFSRLGEEIQAIDAGGADWIHIDVMDGHFVPNLTIGPLVVKAIRKCTKRTFDVHLMIDNPEAYVDAFIDAGADIVTVHAESTVHLHRLVTAITARGVKAGVSINPATPVSVLEEIIPYVDMVLVMSVNPGFGGQKFIETSFAKISKVREMAKAAGKEIIIQVDGGVGDKNIHALKEAGATCVVAGNYVFSAEDYGKAIQSLQI